MKIFLHLRNIWTALLAGYIPLTCVAFSRLLNRVSGWTSKPSTPGLCFATVRQCGPAETLQNYNVRTIEPC